MEDISLWLGAMLGVGFLFGMWVVMFRRDPAPLERARAIYGHAYDEILPTRKLGGRRRRPPERLEPDEPEEEDIEMPTPQEEEEELLERSGWALDNEEELQTQAEVTASEGIEVSDVSEGEIDDFAERLAREGAKTGDVQISLIWNNYNDLDLHVVCPSGERIFFDNRNSKCSGELDVDMNVKPSSRKPVENVYWPENMAPRGTYRVYVHHYAKHSRGFRSNKDPTGFRVLVDMEGMKKEFKGEISNGEPLRLISEFTLEERDDLPPPPTPDEPVADIEELLEEIEQDDSESTGDIGAEYADQQLNAHLEERSAWAEEQEEEFQALMQTASYEGVESGQVTRKVESQHSKRLKREGATSSDVQVSLIWNNYNDLDLHVVAPSGERLFYHNRESECGGRLDIDMNVQPTSRKPVENVYWPQGEASRGTYRVYLHHHQLHRRGLRKTKDPTDFSVLVNAEGEKKEFKGQITIDDPLKLITEFTLEDAEDLLDDIEEVVDELSEEELSEQLDERSRWAEENEEKLQSQTEDAASEEGIEGAELDEESEDEFARRMEREGAKSGGVQISLIWNNYNDLDLHVIAPSGERIFFDNRNSKCGGELDVDMNVKPTSRKPIENVYWPDEQTPRGTYKVYVHHYAVHRKGLRSNKDPTAFSVLVNAEGEKKEFKSDISNGEPLRLVSEFTLPERDEDDGEQRSRAELDTELEERSKWASENQDELQSQTESAEPAEGITISAVTEEEMDEFTTRLEREGAKTGDVQISLFWHNYNDLDLHVIAPSGERIFFDNRNSKCGGELDVDMNVKPTSRKPVENVYWSEGTAPRGTYKAYIHHYAVHRKGLRSNKDPTAFSVIINNEGERTEFSGDISNGEPLRLVSEFTLEEVEGDDGEDLLDDLE